MKVKVMAEQQQSVLVEWFDDGMPRRCILPTGSLRGEYTTRSELERGIEVGEPWDEIELRATSRELCANLRNAGIWTKEDLRKKPEIVIGVLQATYGVDYHTLLRKFGG